MTFVGAKGASMTPFVTGRGTSMAGKRIAVDKPLDCRLSPDEETFLRRMRLLRNLGLNEAEICEVFAKEQRGNERT